MSTEKPPSNGQNTEFSSQFQFVSGPFASETPIYHANNLPPIPKKGSVAPRAPMRPPVYPIPGVEPSEEFLKQAEAFVQNPASFPPGQQPLSGEVQYVLADNFFWRFLGFSCTLYAMMLIFTLIGYPFSKQFIEPIAAFIFPIAQSNSLMKSIMIMSAFFWGTSVINYFRMVHKYGKKETPPVRSTQAPNG